MKIFKTIGNILQLAGAGWFSYFIFVLSMLGNIIGGGSDSNILFQSFILIYLLIGIILVITAFIGLFVTKTKKVRILSILNISLIALYCLLVQFHFDTYMLIGVCVIAFFNLFNATFYKGEKSN